jgi:hypothetical protein
MTDTELLYNKLIEIEADIKSIKADIEVIKTESSKMNKHVDFVNNVYTHVEQPLNYVVNKWNTVFGVENNDSKLLE